MLQNFNPTETNSWKQLQKQKEEIESFHLNTLFAKDGKRAGKFSMHFDDILIDFSKNLGIKIAFEPNVVQEFNLVRNRNELLLLADYDEIELFYKFFKKNEIGLLLDLGHTAVTSHWLNFNKDDFVTKCKDLTLAVHVSNNNGKKDQHKELTKRCWQYSKLKLFKKNPIILETMNLSLEQIKDNIQIAKSALK